MTNPSEPQRSPVPPRDRPSPEKRVPWVKPSVTPQGSVRHLVRGGSGLVDDGFGMPGMAMM